MKMSGDVFGLGLLATLVLGSYGYTYRVHCKQEDLAKKEDTTRIEHKVDLIYDSLVMNGLAKKLEEKK